jgi:superfamily II DNA helicase RecQ
MSDDEFGFSYEDEEALAAATANFATEGKRKLEHNSEHATLGAKRMKARIGTTAALSPSATLANKVLKDRFHLDGFRLEQEGAITRILDGGSAVVVFPTGGGKSLCYQASTSVTHAFTPLTYLGACSRIQVSG